MKFSERKGLKPVSSDLQKNSMNTALRNSLWNVLEVFIWKRKGFIWNNMRESGIEEFSMALWFHFYKEPIDS